jgi:hypothetical protein
LANFFLNTLRIEGKAMSGSLAPEAAAVSRAHVESGYAKLIKLRPWCWAAAATLFLIGTENIDWTRLAAATPLETIDAGFVHIAATLVACYFILQSGLAMAQFLPAHVGDVNRSVWSALETTAADARRRRIEAMAASAGAAPCNGDFAAAAYRAAAGPVLTLAQRAWGGFLIATELLQDALRIAPPLLALLYCTFAYGCW